MFIVNGPVKLEQDEYGVGCSCVAVECSVDVSTAPAAVGVLPVLCTSYIWSPAGGSQGWAARATSSLPWHWDTGCPTTARLSQLSHRLQ